MMRNFCLLVALIGLVLPWVAMADPYEQLPFNTFTPSTYLNSTGLTDDVQWDGYSLFVKGQRIYLYSGEIHNFRNVNPALYPDLMQRIKGLGFNGISAYFFWAIYSESPGVLDFSGWKALGPFLEAANDAGLWVIARPGPWVQGEFSASGTPAWVTGLQTSLRTSDPVFTAAYTPYWQMIGETLAKYQITNGGPVIAVQMENEYYLDGSLSGDLDLNYIQNLEVTMRSYGIVVPLTFNDNPESDNLVKGKGSVNLYGADSYPQNSDCSKPDYWTSVQTYTRGYFQNVSGAVGEPFFIPEFQAGWIPGTDTKGLSQCLPLFSSQFERVFYLNNVAQSIKLQNIYMVYGGTNFGHTAYSRSLTSYDYWAAIEENRALRDKYYELKLIAHFIRSAHDLPKTWIAESGNSTGTSAEEGLIQVDELRNPDTHAGFYVVRHANSSALTVDSFDLDISDWQGNTTLPVTLNGRDSRILTTNYCWGSSCISHSSAAIMTATSLGDVDYLVVYGDQEQPYTLAFPDPNCKIDQLTGSPQVSTSSAYGRTVVNYNISAGETSILKVTGGTREVRVIILDTDTAYFTWEVVVPGQGPLGSHYLVGSNETALVVGPYFVRSASASGSTLSLYGDLNTTTDVYIAASPSYTSFTWNNASIAPTKTSFGLMKVTLPGPSNVPTAPSITGWKWKDSLPEIAYGFDDSDWTTANDTFTNNTNKPFDPDYTGRYVLYGQNYEFAIGSMIWRGHFEATGKETGMNISLSAGPFGVGAFYLNGQYLASAVVNNTGGTEEVNTTISFPPGSVKADSDNVIQIVVDNAGLEEGSSFTDTPQDAQSPRGIRGYSLLGGDSSGYDMRWKVQGNLGGWTNFPDKVRSLYNVGGLYGERQGWYLPGFDDSNWQSGGPDESLGTPGVRFYRGNVEVDYPAGLDVHYSFVFPNVTGGYRAQLFVNGWQFGRHHGDLVNTQQAYPVPPGVLTQGSNSIALSLFAYNNTEASYSIGGPLTIQVDDPVTTTSLDLKSSGVDSPTYDQLFGSGSSSR